MIVFDENGQWTCPWCGQVLEDTGSMQVHTCNGPQELADRLNPPTLRALLAYWWRQVRVWWSP